VGLLPFSISPRRLQRRLSVLLSATLCLWMLASATHFHSKDGDQGSHSSTHELCGFCLSVPGTGAAPSVSVFVPTAQRQHFVSPAEIAPTVTARFIVSYRSRAPPRV
jgi:hypothetical protein